MFNKEEIENRIKLGHVIRQWHPNGRLQILNYGPTVQYEKLWDDITMQTRGLILDTDYNVVARSFRKFFNIEEHKPNEIPNLKFDAFDKLDGSIGILYFLDGKPYIASKGSFTSEQSKRATEILYTKYKHTFDKLNPSNTYVFEIIYPENRIVVNYGDTNDIIQLAVINTITGSDMPMEDIGFPMVKKYDGINDIESLKLLDNNNNKEGFVIRFSNGFRVKMKFAEYVRLHRIVTGVSNIAIWDYMATGKSFDELLERVPDEFYDWVKKTQFDISNNYETILQDCKNSFKILATRKETAIYYQTQKYPSVLFAMLDGFDYSVLIWKLVKPKHSKPFSNNND